MGSALLSANAILLFLTSEMIKSSFNQIFDSNDDISSCFRNVFLACSFVLTSFDLAITISVASGFWLICFTVL